jgi:hypothetical protein
LSRSYARDREARVAMLGAFTVAAAVAATVAAPMLLLSATPLAFGVPHLVADVRYLVLRPGLHRIKALAWVLVPLALVSLTGVVAVGLLAPAVVLVAAPMHARRRAAGLAVWAVATAAALAWQQWATFVFVHAHNLIAVGMWCMWRRRAGRPVIGFALLFVAASAGLVFFGPRSGVAPAAATDDGLRFIVQTVAPFSNPRIAWALVLWFAFAQSVHYGIWLRLIPDEDRARPAPRSFRESYRALRSDSNGWFIAAAAAVALALAVWAVFDLSMARTGYLRLAAFHGYLELAALAWWWARR